MTTDALSPGSNRRRHVLTAASAIAGLLVLFGVGRWVQSPPADEVAAVGIVSSVGAQTCPAGMVFVEGGKLYMGTDEQDDPLFRSASPAHQVSVTSYCMDAHEVTVDDYRACSTGGECEQAHRDSWWPQHQATAPKKWTRATQSLSELCNESYQDRGRHPINCVSWAQARRFCEARSARLPSEIEWEFAARGSEGRLYPWGDEPPSSEHVSACGTECVSWRRRHQLASDEPLYPADDGFPGTAPVGSFPAGSTSLGVFDLAGNVSEWTADVYRPYPGRVLDAGDHEQRVVRGGAFDSARRELLSPALRMGHMEDAHPDGVGFRCAADPGG